MRVAGAPAGGIAGAALLETPVRSACDLFLLGIYRHRYAVSWESRLICLNRMKISCDYGKISVGVRGATECARLLVERE